MSRTSRMEPVTLLASAARTGTTKSSTDTAYGDAFSLQDVLDSVSALVFQLSVTAAAKEAGDILDVYVQTCLDGSNWVDVVRFPQVLGNGGAKRYVARLAQIPLEEHELFEASAAMSPSGEIRNILGRQLRVKYALTNDSDDPVDTSFTFGVVAVPQ